MELYRQGKVKNVYIDGRHMRFVFTDNISVFDLVIPNKIPGKGRSLCLTAEFWFNKLKSLGIRNHFIALESDIEMVVERFEIKPRLNKGDKGCLIPLEFITRHYVAGSLYRRMKSGKLDPKTIGLPRVEYGKELEEPYFEITTKFEPYDRGVGIDEAMAISGLDKAVLDEIMELCFRIDEAMSREVAPRGLIHVDGKKEFAIDGGGEIVVVDTFGTCDEDRWWDRVAYESGKVIELSKEFVRQYYIDSGFQAKLEDDRSQGREPRGIPPLPEELVERTSELYMNMYERITGRKW